jgi:hypothetical protein
VKTNAKRNSFQAKTITKTASASMPCADSGRITRRRMVKRLAPSTSGGFVELTAGSGR